MDFCFQVRDVVCLQGVLWYVADCCGSAATIVAPSILAVWERRDDCGSNGECSDWLFLLGGQLVYGLLVTLRIAVLVALRLSRLAVNQEVPTSGMC